MSGFIILTHYEFLANYCDGAYLCLNKLEQSKLIELFNIIQLEIPNVQFSTNKNGYFIDIKQLPSNLIEILETKCNDYMTTKDQ